MMPATQTAEQKAAWDALYEAHVLYIKELANVHYALSIFKIIGLNTNKLRGSGTEFLRFSSVLAQRTLVLGIESLFERTNSGNGLCSVRGLRGLAEKVPLTNDRAAYRFLTKYGVQPTSDWQVDVEKVLDQQRPLVAECTRHTSRTRNQRMAHLVQTGTEPSAPLYLPSIDVLEKVVTFAHDFYVFIASGFLQGSGAELPDHVGNSLLGMLKERFQITDALSDFPEPVSR